MLLVAFIWIVSKNNSVMRMYLKSMVFELLFVYIFVTLRKTADTVVIDSFVLNK